MRRTRRPRLERRSRRSALRCQAAIGPCGHCGPCDFLPVRQRGAHKAQGPEAKRACGRTYSMPRWAVKPTPAITEDVWAEPEPERFVGRGTRFRGGSEADGEEN